MRDTSTSDDRVGGGSGLGSWETRRKVVTVVFADVVGSTALGERVDSETLRWAMQRWFDRMRVAVERHSGAIENDIGHGQGPSSGSR